MNTEFPQFFLGAVGPSGFRNHFGEIYSVTDGWRAYILKGGPGTGKSTLMRSLAAAANAAGQPVWISPCSSDPDSLDAVVLPERRVCMLDGTAPHVVEPSYPGICEVLVNLGDHYDCDLLALSADRIYSRMQDCSALHSRARRYIAVAAGMAEDNARAVAAYTDLEAVARWSAALARRLLPKRDARAGLESVRYLGAVTPRGYIFNSHTVSALCPTVKIIEDEYGAASAAALAAFRLVAIERGYDIISCPSVLSATEAPEHILVPDAGVALCTRSSRCPIEGRAVHATRFADRERLRAIRGRLAFNRRAVGQLIEAAAESMSAARTAHDKLERYYIDAMDFDALSRRSKQLIESIVG